MGVYRKWPWAFPPGTRPFWAEEDAHISSSRKLGAHTHLQGCICGNPAELSRWTSSVSCVYIWLKLLCRDEDESLCGGVLWGLSWGLGWECMDMTVEGEKAPDVACLGPWRGNRDKWAQRKEVRCWLHVSSSWQSFWKVASFFISS